MSTGAVDYYYLEVIQVGYYLRAAALALIVYEYFLTLDDEVQLFWKGPWTIATYLFLWTRYGGMLLLVCTLSLVTRVSDRLAAFVFSRYLFGLTHHNVFLHCKAWFFVEICLGMVNTWVIETILFLRLYALYNCSRKIVYATALVFLMQMLSLVAVAAVQLPNDFLSMEASAFGGVAYCEVRSSISKHVTWLYWLFFALFEAFILSLTIRKGNAYYRRQDSCTLRLTNLVSTLYWDSVYYMILIEVFYISNIILNWINGENYDVLSGIGLTLPIIMGGRMMINVRRTISDIRYRQSPSSPSQITFFVTGVDIPNQPPAPAPAPPPKALTCI